MLRTESSVCYCLICLCKINYLLQTLYPYCSQLSSKCFRWEPLWDSPGGSAGKEPTCQSRRCKRCRFDPWVGKIPWRREWQPPPVFLPEELYRQRSLQATVHGVTKSQTQPNDLLSLLSVPIISRKDSWIFMYESTLGLRCSIYTISELIKSWI